MIEFEDEGGGRYLFTDDIINLQELALSMSEIFNGCGNFVISGCDVSGTTISSGYVYIDGKVRYYSGATGVSSWPQYIYATEETDNVLYKNNGTGLGRTTYAAASQSDEPDTEYISIASDGSCTTIKDAFIGKYALLMDPSDSDTEQSVSSSVNVSGTLTATALTATDGEKSLTCSYDGDYALIKSTTANGDYCSVGLYKDERITFNINGTTIAELTSSDATVNGNLNTTTLDVSNYGEIGNIKIVGSQIYLNGAEYDTSIYINNVGYDGGTDYLRSIYFGDGRGNDIFVIKPADDFGDSCIYSYCPIRISSGNSRMLQLVDSTYTTGDEGKENDSPEYPISYIQWSDCNEDGIGYAGFTNTSDCTFLIQNVLGAIRIEAESASAVNIVPAIKEDGTLLSEKYQPIIEDTGLVQVYKNSSYFITYRKIGSIVHHFCYRYVDGSVDVGDELDLSIVYAPMMPVSYSYQNSEGYISGRIPAGEKKFVVDAIELTSTNAFFYFTFVYIAEDD